MFPLSQLVNPSSFFFWIRPWYRPIDLYTVSFISAGCRDVVSYKSWEQKAAIFRHTDANCRQRRFSGQNFNYAPKFPAGQLCSSRH